MALILGESTSKGFYLYGDKHKASPDPEIVKYIEKARRISRVTVDFKVSLSLSHTHTLTDTFFLVYLEDS